MVTVSIVTVHSALELCEAAARPSSTVPDIAATVWVNSVCQVVLSVLYEPTNVVPVRTMRMYCGGRMPATVPARVVVAPDAERYSTNTPLPGVISTENCADPAVVSARIITPALAHALLLLCPVMCASIVLLVPPGDW